MSMSDVLRSADEATPARLTAILRSARVLPRGEVVEVRQCANSAFNSVVTHLELRYSDDTPALFPTTPSALVLKRNLPLDWARESGKREVDFYRMVAAVDALPDHPPYPPIMVPCYDAQYDPASGDSHLLLRDVCATHHAPRTRDQQLTVQQAGQEGAVNVPADADADAVVVALARLHAYWWDHPRLGASPLPIAHWFRDEAGFARLRERRTAAFHELIAAEGAWFPDDYARTYETVLAGLPYLWEHRWRPRTIGRQGLTLTHGDAYFTNFLCPNELNALDKPDANAEDDRNVYLLDWQSPEVYLGASDLANLLATFLTSVQRKENGREERLLRLYHATLEAAGVPNFSYDALLDDYRLTILDWLLVPLQDRRDGSPQTYWWPKMQCLMEAFRDWRCEELLPVALGFTYS